MGSRQPDSGNGAAEATLGGVQRDFYQQPSIMLLDSESLCEMCQSRGLWDISLKISMLNCVFIWPQEKRFKNFILVSVLFYVDLLLQT